ncbi:MAG: hypothetical protein ACR2KK_04225 [Acidimicrobiales bacterium]
MTSLADLEEIIFPKDLYWQLVGHARRKLAGHYLAGEERAPKAYGLVGGQLLNGHGEVTHVVPLLRNQRDAAHLKPVLDQVMDDLAIRSETPLDRRGWVSDPLEIAAADELFDAAGAVLFGGYHMHRVPWEHDPIRDSCTDVDTELGADSGLWMFILAMVDRENPVLRAYFEGDNGHETPVRAADYREHQFAIEPWRRAGGGPDIGDGAIAR